MGVALVGGLVTYAQAAGAASQPTIKQVTAQVSALTTKENKAIQQYDLVNQQLKAAQASLKQVNAQEAKDQAQFNTMRTGIAQVAATAYEDGNMTSMVTVLTTANPQDILSKAALLVQLSSIRYAEMHQFINAARQLNGAQQQEKRTEASIEGLRNQAKATAGSINKSLKSKKTLLATLTASEQQQVEKTATVGTGGSQNATDPLPASGSQANEAVAFAYKQIGCPYVYGGTGPCGDGFDCSGLVQAAWAAAGVSIPRDTYEQWDALPHIPLSDLRPGDLIYFAGESHVGMYVWDGELIDAPQPGMNVEKISLSESWYADNEDGAVRP
jgi:cell wall-associated NlpC family hydrolase